MAKPTEPPAKGFDERLAQLDQIVLAIDSGQLGLEESMERYREGMRLYRELKGEIEQHRRRFEELAADGSSVAHPADEPPAGREAR